MTLMRRVKDAIIGSPFEGAARWARNRTSWSQDAEYDRQTIAVMWRSLSKDANCIDVGCHRGKILREILRVAPNGVHYAFEPVPDSYRRLVSLYPNVALYNVALGDVVGEMRFDYVITDPALSSLIPRDSDSQERIAHITTTVERLDNIVPDTLPIRFIKIDVEGAELQVLRGAARTIERNRPIVVFEHAPDMRSDSNTTSEDIYDFFSGGCGMRVSLMERWLKTEGSLSRDEFVYQVQQRRDQYFMAYEEL